MITPTRPANAAVEIYRLARVEVAPTCVPADGPLDGFHRASFSRAVGSTQADFDRAKAGLMAWAAHRGAGVEVFPPDAAITPGETVAIVTRQLGLWVVAACRIVSVVDEPTRFGFTYATLPDHPECGEETFMVRRHEDVVVFDIKAVSRPGIALVRLIAPIGRALQRRAANGYLTALHNWTASGS